MKGFVFIYHPEMIDRFVTFGAFDVLERDHDITYVLPGHDEFLFDRVFAESFDRTRQKAEIIPFYGDRFASWNELLDLSCLIAQERSISIKKRWSERSKQDQERFETLGRLENPE